MKEKINAAKVIKHMSEKELEQYDITLETKSKSYIPDWFKPFASMLENIATFVVNQERFNKNQEKFNKTILKRLDNIDSRLDKHDQMFKQHGWIK